jgi:hypothetical protein
MNLVLNFKNNGRLSLNQGGVREMKKAGRLHDKLFDSQ